ncbi:MAG: hypothetical protein FJY65_08245 [Calditrichaeota bacterium]|nr:hypothetical protein [Calditrichota bacterium]
MKRIFEIAVELKVTTQSILEYLGRLGYDITRNQMQPVNDEMHLALLYKFDEKRVPEFSQSRPNISDLINGLKRRLMQAKGKETTEEPTKAVAPLTKRLIRKARAELEPEKKIITIESKPEEEEVLPSVVPNIQDSFKSLIDTLQSEIKSITKSSVAAIDKGDFESARLPLERAMNVSKLLAKLKEIQQEWSQLLGEIKIGEEAPKPSAKPGRKRVERPVELPVEKPAAKTVEKVAPTPAKKPVEQPVAEPAAEPTAKPKIQRLPQGTLTSPKAFVIPVLKALDDLGGKGSRNEVIKKLATSMKGILNNYDLEDKPSRPGIVRWHITMDKARVILLDEGLLMKDSPLGVWEINPKGKEFLKKETA